MNDSKGFFIKYVGPAVNDGTIEIGGLISGLSGLAEASSVITRTYLGPKDSNVGSLKIGGFDHGSFAVVLEFIESHPVLIKNINTILVASVGVLAYHYTERQNPPGVNKAEVLGIVEAIISSPQINTKMRKAFYQMSMPLTQQEIDGLYIGLYGEDGNEIINQDNKDVFIDLDLDSEIIHKSIELKGALRALDKKTLKGKFVSGNATYPVKLAMDSPQDYFSYFPKRNVVIKGVASYDTTKDNKMIQIEVEKIEDN